MSLRSSNWASQVYSERMRIPGVWKDVQLVSLPDVWFNQGATSSHIIGLWILWFLFLEILYITYLRCLGHCSKSDFQYPRGFLRLQEPVAKCKLSYPKSQSYATQLKWTYMNIYCMPEYSTEMMFEPRTAWIFVPPPSGRNEAPYSSEASIIRTDFLSAGHQ